MGFTEISTPEDITSRQQGEFRRLDAWLADDNAEKMNALVPPSSVSEPSACEEAITSPHYASWIDVMENEPSYICMVESMKSVNSSGRRTCLGIITSSATDSSRS